MLIEHQKTFYSGSVTGQITTVGTAATYTGLCLTNPNFNTPITTGRVKLVVTRVGAAFLVVFPAASVVGLMTGFSATAVTQTTPITPQNQWNGAAGVGLLASAATLPGSPVLTTVLSAGLTGAITTIPDVTASWNFQDGELVIPPGGYIAIYTSTASGTAAGAFSFKWYEQVY
jgi:hypothetical protein